jgi:hypothetical protein
MARARRSLQTQGGSSNVHVRSQGNYDTLYSIVWHGPLFGLIWSWMLRERELMPNSPLRETELSNFEEKKTDTVSRLIDRLNNIVSNTV